MKLFLFFLSLLALVPKCMAEISALEAARILYYYTSYDLDYEVSGRNRTIARGCKGADTSKKCTFNEFLNFVQTGEPSAESPYWTDGSDVSLYIGDSAAAIEALRTMPSFNQVVAQARMVKARASAVGLFHDLAKIADANYKAAETRNFPVGRHRANMKLALGSVSYYTRASGEGSMLDRLRQIREVQWKIVQESSEYSKTKHERVAWKDTVAANPDLMDRNSRMYKNVADAIKGLRTHSASLADQTMALRAADVFESCFK